MTCFSYFECKFNGIYKYKLVIINESIQNTNTQKYEGFIYGE